MQGLLSQGDDAMLRRARSLMVGAQVTEILVAHGRARPVVYSSTVLNTRSSSAMTRSMVYVCARCAGGIRARADAHTGGVDDPLDELVGVAVA